MPPVLKHREKLPPRGISLRLVIGMAFTWMSLSAELPSSFDEDVSHHYAKNGDTSIHYASLGTGPLIVMVHGFPDYWYSWRQQMNHLSASYRTLALDQRGYNRSDKPEGQQHYKVKHLVNDLRAVIEDTKQKSAIIVGHDWGGFVAWNFAMTYPEMTDKLIILNLPHPVALSRELAHNPRQQANSQYARNFQQEGAHLGLTAEGLVDWVKSPDAKEKYIEAFNRSNFEAMLHFYKANYPTPPYQEFKGSIVKVQCPVLMFHGLDDWALLPDGLNKTWEFLEQDLTLITLPGAGHFVQQDRSKHVSLAMESWLQLQESLQSSR